MSSSKKLIFTGLYAVGMAYVEAAAVLYLRRAYGIQDLLPTPALYDPALAFIEVGRESATILMLISVAWITGQSLQQRSGYFVYAFGIWDIFYYLWLKLFIHWPITIMDMDILFFIPLPWWGPVLAPVLISLLMIAFGMHLVMQSEYERLVKFKIHQSFLLCMGILVMLFSFMQDALQALFAGKEVVDPTRPVYFNWIVFLSGYSLVVLIFLHLIRTGTTQKGPINSQ